MYKPALFVKTEFCAGEPAAEISDRQIPRADDGTRIGFLHVGDVQGPGDMFHILKQASFFRQGDTFTGKRKALENLNN